MKILFFAPHSAIWVHAFPEALVAEALEQGGNEVVYVTCGRALRTLCLPMTAHGLRWDSDPDSKEKICQTCDAHKQMILSNFGFKGFDLATHILPIDEEAANSIMAAITRENMLSFRYEGVEVGRYALYSLLINHKKSELNLSDDEWQEYVTSLRNVLLSAMACKRILDEERPDVVIVYNSLYAVPRVCVDLAQAQGKTAYFLHAGPNLSNRLQTLIMGQSDWFCFSEHQKAHWRTYGNRPCGSEELRAVTDHMIELFTGRSSFVYSSPASQELPDIRTLFGIEPRQKVLLATMSSYDELFAAQVIRAVPEDEALVFPSQVEWVQAMINFVACRPELFLIVRVHPREFPNKREGQKADHATALEAVFQKLPKNVRINWPAQGLSLYDVAEEADVVLNAWSSAGREMTLLGLPVVVYAPHLLPYASDINYVGTSREEYFACIEQALHDGWSIENIRKGYRWHALEFKSALIDISDSYSHNETRHHRSMLQRTFNAVARRLAQYFDQRRDCARRASQLASAELINWVVTSRAPSVLMFDTGQQRQTITVTEETVMLRTELRRLVRARYGRDTTTSSHRPTLKERLIEFSTASSCVDEQIKQVSTVL